MRIVWFASPTMTPSFKARSAGFGTGRRVASLTMRKTSSRGRPRRVVDNPTRKLFGDLIEERYPTLRVGRDHCVADTRQGDAVILPLDAKGIGGPLPLGEEVADAY